MKKIIMMPKNLKEKYRYLLLFVLLSSWVPLAAQNLTEHNWYFGNGTSGIQFNRPNYSASLVNRPAVTYGVGGGSVATDPISGNLLFYTDGNNVYDINHALMVNGSGLAGDPNRNQAAAICKMPGSPTQYYIFTNSASGTIQFSVVDMGIGGTFPAPTSGEVLDALPFLKNTAVAGLPSSQSEAMIIIPHFNGEDFWLITHDSNTNNFYRILIDATGVGIPAPMPQGLIQNPANFAYNPSLGQLAVSPKGINSNIEILSFDNKGVAPLTLVQTVLNSAVATAATQAIYDVEWSKNGQYLYVSYHGDAGLPLIQADVLQFDLTNPTLLPSSVLTQPNTISRSFGLQMAPDSTIYHLYEKTPGVFLVGKITDTDSVAGKVIYRQEAFKKGLASINFNAQQFPSFAPKDTVNLMISFVAVDTCANSPTSFFPTVKPAADSLVWDFGDGSFGKGWNPVHTYANGGAVNVKAKAYLNGDTAVFVKTVNIVQFSLQISLVQDTTACSSELPYPKNKTVPGCTSGCFALTAQASGGTPSATQWYGPAGLLPSQTTTTLKPDSAGYYYVIATDASAPGCQAYAGVNIKEYGVQDLRANIWHFGQNAGIDFNPVFRTPSTPAISIPGPLNTMEGCADICDRNGQILFSTDGQNIFDRDGTDITPLPNPPGLGGNQDATQSSIIVPVPGDETLFYIFTTQPIYGGNFELRYSLFDLKKGANGSVVEYNQLLFSKSTERITSNGTWLIAHEYGNDAFRAYPISANGIGNPVITNIGSDHSFNSAGNGQGYMELGPQNTLAVALSTPNVSNAVELFTFDNATGVLSKYRVANTKIASGQIYGIEFSGNKLLATIRNTPNSQLVEFALDSLLRPHLITPPAAPIAAELGAIQIGPDNQIYVAINNSSSLGILTVNPDTLQTSTINLTGFALKSPSKSNLGLPNFIQIIGNPAQGPSMSVAGVCFGSPTDFTGSGTDVIDTLSWFFGDGSGVKGANMTQASHTYAAPGKYTVVLRISNRCVGFITDITQQIEIFGLPPDPSTSLVLCSNPESLDANPSNASQLAYLWANSDTTRVLNVTQPGLYSVNITNVNGCSTTGNFDVFSPLPQPIDLGQDSVVCAAAGASKQLNTNLNFPTHVWTLNGAPIGGTGQSQLADFSTPGTYKYKVVFTDPFSGCVASDSVTYLVRQPPAFTAPFTNPSACINNGQINLTITQPATSTFSYVVTSPAPGVPQSGSGISANALTPILNLGAGAQVVRVTDMLTNCSTNLVDVLTDNSAFTVSGTQNGTCDPSIKINIATTAALPFTYRIINSVTAQVVETGISATISGSLPSANSYIIEVTSGVCTNASTPVPLAASPTLLVSFNTSICNGVLSATTVPATATSFDWTASQAGSLANPNVNANTVNVNSSPTPWNIVVVASNGGTDCPGTGTTKVIVDVITPDFTNSTCTTPIKLTATPAGSYLYNWSIVGPPLTALAGSRQINATKTGTYRLSVQSTLSGCPPAGPVDHVIDLTLLSQLSVTINPFSNNMPPCVGIPFQLTATTNRPVTSYQWTLNGGNTANSTSNPLPATLGGNYQVTVTDGNCQDSDNIVVVLAPVTQGNMQSAALICPEANPPEEVVLRPGNQFKSYTWFENGTQVPNSFDSVFSATAPGTYRVDLINSFGCPSSDMTVIDEECNPILNAPKAFRPGSTIASNVDFHVYPIFISPEGFQVFIFNRWGEMVYQSDNLDFKWNGTYNNTGLVLPPGTYSWVAKFKSVYRPEEGIKEKHGGVVLLR